MATTSQTTFLTTADSLLVNRFISSGQIIVEVSSGNCQWIEYALSQHSRMRALLYAPSEVESEILADAGSAKSTEAHSGTSHSSQGNNIDSDAKAEGVRHIHFLRISDARRVRSVLSGVVGLLRHSRIDFLSFTLNSFDIWTGQAISDYLIDSFYLIFEVVLDANNDVSLQRYRPWAPERAHREVTILAMHERLDAVFRPGQDYRNYPIGLRLVGQQGIPLRGLIHVGAHDGSRELQHYQALPIEKCLLIEANPRVFPLLQENCGKIPKFQLVNCAIVDRAGPVDLYLTDYDEACSTLKPSSVLELYDFIHEAGVVKVPGFTIDGLLEELKLDPHDYNILSIDIQGGELRALRGATKSIPHFDAILTEVNFENMYDGCGQIDEIDDFLAQFGFYRASTLSIHRAWGDAVYLKQPLVTPRTLRGSQFFMPTNVFSPSNPIPGYPRSI